MKLREFFKKIVFQYTKFGAPSYEYNIEPAQLCEIISSIDKVCSEGREAQIFEIGVAKGQTTRFIAEHIKKSNLKVNFYCLDTFASFTEKDLNFEVEQRGKNKRDLYGFAYNDFQIWARNFSSFKFVKPIKIDVSEFDFSKIFGGVDFIFLDCDLYLPTLNVLQNCKQYLNDGAIVIVDDVKNNNRWDGAYQAFFEFVKDENLKYEMIGNKCGKLTWKKHQK